MIAIKERPILFSAPMVRAILEGRKTVTRRIVKGWQAPSKDGSEEDPDFRWSAIAQKHPRWGFCVFGSTSEECAQELASAGVCPYGQRGDRLWVRETWYCDHHEVMRGPYLQPADMVDLNKSREDGELVYAADGLTPYEADQPIWKPSIHMPRWTSRVLLEITDVRVERLQDISEEQAKAEGVRLYTDHAELGDWWYVEGIETYSADPRKSFELLWSSVGGDWNANPWVWVVEFKRVTP